MARPAPPVDTIRLAINGTFLTHRWTNVMWAKVTSSGTRTVNDLAAIIDGFAVAYNARFMPLLAPDVAGFTIDGVWQTGAATVLANERTSTHTGGGGGAINDASACLLVDWKIAARYRGGKPRTYIPGPQSIGISNGGALTSTFRASAAAAAISFMADVNALTSTNITACELGTVSFFTAGGSTTIPPTYRTPPVFEAYIGSGIRSRLATQRRRINN